MRGVVAGAALGTALYAAVARRLPHPRGPERCDGALLATVAVSATVEELLWRGVLLRLLVRRDPLLALLATSAGFALSHLPQATSRALVVYAALGGAFGVVASRPHGLAAASTAHVTYDLLALLEEPP